MTRSSNRTSEMMADSSDPPSDGSAAGDSASSPSPQWCAKQWSVLCDVLDVSDPTEVVPRVKALQASGATEASPSPDEEALSADTEALFDQLDAASPAEARKRVTTLIEQMEQLYREKETLADAGLASAEEAVAEIDRLKKKCAPPDSESSSTPASSSAANTEIADRLGIDTVDDAQELEDMVRRMTETLDALQDNRETLRDELGVAEPRDVLDLVRSLQKQLEALYDTQTQSSGAQLASQIEEILGISNVEDAHELEALVHRMNERLDDVTSAQETLHEAGYDPESALATIDSMEEQLVSLYEERESYHEESGTDDALADAVSNVLGLSTPEEVREMSASVRRMGERLEQLQAEQHALVDAGLTAEDALDMLENMSDQLSALYEARDERTEALLSQIDALTDTLGVPPAEAAAPQAALDHVLDAVGTASPAQSTGPDDDSSVELAAIQRVLGISSVEEAKDLAAVAENMSEQLEALYDDRAQLQEVGVSSVESAVEMIQSMSTQLDELYEEQELLQGRPAPDELKEQDTFEQLAALYAEQEKLERALGVSEADAIIEMVEGLKDQLEAFSSDRDETSLSTASSSYSPTAVEDHTANGTEPERRGPISLKRLKQTPVFTSMRDQLESLYEEKEALLNMGIDDVQTAAGRIDELEARLSTLQHKHEQCRDRMEHLRRELGTAKVEEIVDMVSPSMETPPSHGSTPPDAPHDSRPGEDVPTVLPQETLTDIDDRPEEDLDALSVGVLRLDDDGAIEYLNEAALALPGLDAESPRADLLDAFFFQAVPSTSNTLFLNRFRTGVDQEKMDVRFPYTFVSPQHPPTAFYVHLYRSGPSGANWIFLRPVR